MLGVSVSGSTIIVCEMQCSSRLATALPQSSPGRKELITKTSFYRCAIISGTARTHLPAKLLPYLLYTVYPTGSCTYPYKFKILYPILNFRYDMFTRYFFITTHIFRNMIRYNKVSLMIMIYFQREA